MYRKRRYQRRSYRPRYTGIKFVTDAVAATFAVPGPDAANVFRMPVIDATSIAGVRRTRNFRIEVVSPVDVMFALIYFPEGINPANATLNISIAGGITSLYTPEQHIMTSGIATAGALTHASSTFGRSLSSGDKISIIGMKCVNEATDAAHKISIRVTFSITFG